jgi:hypothetical protein
VCKMLSGCPCRQGAIQSREKMQIIVVTNEYGFSLSVACSTLSFFLLNCLWRSFEVYETRKTLWGAKWHCRKKSE